MNAAQEKLTTKQQRFVDAYQGNATQAALAAGYSPKTARQVGQENLTKPYIIAAIKARQAIEASPVIASRQARQKFWTEVMQNQKESMKERLKASELLGKSEADFTENLNLKVGLEDKLKAMSDDELAARLAAVEAVVKRLAAVEAVV